MHKCLFLGNGKRYQNCFADEDIQGHFSKEKDSPVATLLAINCRSNHKIAVGSRRYFFPHCKGEIRFSFLSVDLKKHLVTLCNIYFQSNLPDGLRKPDI